jgi:hypothetical protein
MIKTLLLILYGADNSLFLIIPYRAFSVNHRTWKIKKIMSNSLDFFAFLWYSIKNFMPIRRNVPMKKQFISADQKLCGIRES